MALRGNRARSQTFGYSQNPLAGNVLEEFLGEKTVEFFGGCSSGFLKCSLFFLLFFFVLCLGGQVLCSFLAFFVACSELADGSERLLSSIEC